MKALIIGAAGFVGGHLINHLAADCGYEVYATRSTAKVLQENGVNAIKVNKLSQESPTVIDLLLEHKIDIVE